MSSNLPPLRPPPRPHSPFGHRSQSSLSQSSLRSESSLSTTSNDSSQVTAPSTGRQSPYLQQAPARPSTASGPPPSQNTPTLQARPQYPVRTSIDSNIRAVSPNMPGQQIGHRARQYSQGFFEPSLPHATANNNGLSASQIAAQAAMHHISPPPSYSNERKRSHPGLAPINTVQLGSGRRLNSDTQSPQISSAGGLPYANGTLGGNKLAATSAANAAFPNSRTPLPSPGIAPTQFTRFPDPPLDKEPKSKSSKMKLFSKPKNISLSKDKDSKVPPSLPSPGKSSSTLR